jgi:hypothetical protein
MFMENSHNQLMVKAQFVFTNSRKPLLMALPIIASMPLMFRYFDPIGKIPSCPIKAVTGLDCPACGSSRCLLALSRGDFVSAVDQNLLFVVMAFSLLVGTTMLGLLGNRFLIDGFLYRTLSVLAVLAISFSVVRNTPWALGEWLAAGLYQN